MSAGGLDRGRVLVRRAQGAPHTKEWGCAVRATRGGVWTSGWCNVNERGGVRGPSVRGETCTWLRTYVSHLRIRDGSVCFPKLLIFSRDAEARYATREHAAVESMH